MNDFRIGDATGLSELGSLDGSKTGRTNGASKFASALGDAVQQVEELQDRSEAAQVAFAEGAPVELHDVLIQVEEAEVAFKTMMEVRTKLLRAYDEVMRMGG